MPKYKVKPETWGMCEVAKTDKKKHYPTVYFPVNKEIVNALEIGESAEVTLRGKIVGLEVRENDEQESKSEVRMEIHEVEAYMEGAEESAYKELSKDEEG